MNQKLSTILFLSLICLISFITSKKLLLKNKNLSSSQTACPLTILRADYGFNVDGYGADRTSYFRAAVASQGGNSLNYTFLYSATGGDPYPGQQKYLQVVYQFGSSAIQTYTSPQGQEAGMNLVINIPATTSCVPKVLASYPTTTTNCPLTILSALYGINVDGIGSDRTSYFNSAVASQGGNSLKYSFLYSATGGDPYPGQQKQLLIEYQYGDSAPQYYVSPAGQEAGLNLAINFPAVSSCQSCTFQIYRAVYGSNVDGNGRDRSKWFSQCNGKTQCLYTFLYSATGGDPYPGHQKNLIVEYTANGGPLLTYTTPAGIEAGMNAVIDLSCTAAPPAPFFCNPACRNQCGVDCDAIVEMCIFTNGSNCNSLKPGCLNGCYLNPSAYRM